jgi:hypothetical protein
MQSPRVVDPRYQLSETAVEFHQALMQAGCDAGLTVLKGASRTLLRQGPYGPAPEAFEGFLQQVLVTARS